jgi:hypothetical protein
VRADRPRAGAAQLTKLTLVVGGASKPRFVANTPEEGLPLAAILRVGIGMMPAFQIFRNH